MTPSLDRSYAEQLDREDSLAAFREAFHFPRGAHGGRSVYLCGHSLGLQPKDVAHIVGEELDAWATLAVDAHFSSKRPWVAYHEQLTPGLARLAGALPSEVVAMNSLSVNLHLMLASFYRPQGRRRKVLIEHRAFSSDRYAVRSHIQHRGLDPADTLIELAPRAGSYVFDCEEICEAIAREAEELALVLLPGVQYLSGQSFDMAAITTCARRHGCTIGFDLAHAIGNVPLHLHDWDVDFAVWCSYKYLNGGPGAIGGCFVHERHGRAFELPRLAGWWGHDKRSRFAMPDNFVPLTGAEGWQISNPPILAAAPLLASLALFERAGLEPLRAKSIRLTGYLESLLRAWLGDTLEILTPRNAEARGCQLSLRLNMPSERARRIHEQLHREGFVCDWREPDVIRVAPVPLYNSFVDVWQFANALRSLCST
ncbi:MAG: kynureninase [Gammaproteobacteria bacterium]|nr:kynureninase [Gammaproteobacteria bacterium]